MKRTLTIIALLLSLIAGAQSETNTKPQSVVKKKFHSLPDMARNDKEYQCLTIASNSFGTAASLIVVGGAMNLTAVLTHKNEANYVAAIAYTISVGPIIMGAVQLGKLAKMRRKALTAQP